MFPWLTVGLLGCQANDDDLEQFFAQTDGELHRAVETLEPVKAFVPLMYTSSHERDPFQLPRVATTAAQSDVNKSCWQPPSRKGRGKLERYPLDQLKLKGVMGSAGEFSALVQTSDNVVLSVSRGQYIGLNNGRILNVTPRYLLIDETLPDGLGCWLRRSVKLVLKYRD
jgi:type IV pilus assembly protein PilP